ncbi:MAG: hypothetical protein ACRCZF_23565 [Gemmataceae bacterium]
MNTIINIQSGPDAKLHFDIPVDQPDTEYEVRLTVQAKPTMFQEQWRAWVQSMAGSITDPTFERPPQLPITEREPLT